MRNTRKFTVLGWAGLLVAVLGTGCSSIKGVLGVEGEYLLSTYDALTEPGEVVLLVARLESGTLLHDVDNCRVRFLKDGKLFKTVITSDEGFASTRFNPTSPGDYVFVVEVEAGDLRHKAPESRELLVACRTVDTPMFIVDLDDTLSESGSWSFFGTNPESRPGSVAVMNRLAKDYSPIYLTYRPRTFAAKSAKWLRMHGYPSGPILMPKNKELLKGSGRFKEEKLRVLGSKFGNIRIGIGDKISDAKAYHENGMKTFLIPRIGDPDHREEYLDLAEDLGELPDEVQVVSSWTQIEAAIYEGESFPRSAAQTELRSQAAGLKKRKKIFWFF